MTLFRVVCMTSLGILSNPASNVWAQGLPPPPPEERSKYCVAVYSHNYNRQNPEPIHYKYRWCRSSSSCGAWRSDVLEPGSTAFKSHVKCYNTARRPQLKIRYDWKFTRGYQQKSYDLVAQKFPYVRNRVPSSACIRSGAYHFVSRGDGLYLYRGEPKNLKRGRCSWRASN